MSMNNLLADTLTRIRNAQMIKSSEDLVHSSGLILDVLSVMKDEGYIDNYSKKSIRPGVSMVEVKLKYYRGEPVIKFLSVISKPGCRSYAKVNSIPTVYSDLGTIVMSTSKGVISAKSAKAAGVGGELLCKLL